MQVSGKDRRNGHKIESDLLSDECKQRALKILSWIDDPGIEIDGGKCHSPNFAHNDYTDCFHVLGKCSKCPYYECDESSVEADRIDYEEQIARVKIWIQSLAKLKDYEDLMNKAENMSHAGAIYEASLLKSIIKGDRHNEQ